MAESKIEWTDYTFNPWRGCTKISPGCANCYAEKMSHRNPAVLGEWGPQGKRAMAAESYWQLPPRWNRKAEKEGVSRRVFCASLADIFEDRPELEAPRRRLFELIGTTWNLDWLVLTKRPENVYRLTVNATSSVYEYLQNITLGVSIEDQKTADLRIPRLYEATYERRFLSCEPLLGPLSLNLGGIDWVIVGGESGPKARPMHIDWVRSIRNQCIAADVPFFFKQWGEYNEQGVRVGKKKAGRLLDGREWNETLWPSETDL